MHIHICILTTNKVIQGGPKKQHKVYGTKILQPYITVLRFSAKCSRRNSLHD